MKLLIDFLPIVLFFIIYKLYGLNLAIMAMILATFIQLVYSRIVNGKFEKIQIITFVLLIIFGGLTLWINDPAFIMWKVSVLYVAFAFALFFSLFTKQTLLQKILGKELELTQQIWRKITYLWVFGFSIIAVINGYFVNIALKASDLFFQKEGIEKLQLSDINCLKTSAIQLCKDAKIGEENWVNFKLFGTLGLTILLIIITIIFIKKYLKK